MSRKRRLEALRARRASGVAPVLPDPEPYADDDPSLGLPMPESLPERVPIPVPSGLRGAYQTCGMCGSYVAPEDEGRCHMCR